MLQALTLSPARDRLASFWRDYPREILGLSMLGLGAAAALAGAAQSTPELLRGSAISTAKSSVAPPAPPPLLVRQLPPQEALTINREIPLIQGPNPVAPPFVMKADSATRARALECLTSAVYYEAGSQNDDGERAVAQVVLNRVRHPAFPASICDVVYQGSTRTTGCQFTFTCDGSLLRRPDLAGWARAHRIAEAALGGYVYAPVGYATHYHADYVVPYWASTLAKNAVVGAHIFYRWAGSWGQPAAFTKRYSGREPSAQALRSTAWAVQAAAPALLAQRGSEQELLKIRQAHDIQVMDTIFASANDPAGKRVTVRFNPAARKAVEDAPHSEYVDKFKASDNLRWTLSSETASANEKPLGKAGPEAAGGSTTTAAAQH